MDCFVWNCRGAGGRALPRLLQDLRRQHGFHFLALLETRQNGSKTQALASRLKFNSAVIVEAQGFKGGIWCFWDTTLDFEVLVTTTQLIHGVLHSPSQPDCYVTVVYGSPHLQSRRDLWLYLRQIGGAIQGPWCILGDFNAILHHDERLSKSLRPIGVDKYFYEWVTDYVLFDIAFYGPKFTWNNKMCFSRLDRALVNKQWRDKFLDSTLLHLPKFKSDHNALLLKISSREDSTSKKHSFFRFFAPWVMHEGFTDFVGAL